MLVLQESHPHSTYEKEESRKNKVVPTVKLSQLPSGFPEDYLFYPPMSPKEALQGSSSLGHRAAPQYAGVCGINYPLTPHKAAAWDPQGLWQFFTVSVPFDT